MLKARHLAVFRAVAAAGSVTGAARALHVSQPAVTKTLRLLEESLDVQLFERIKGRLLITPEALSLAPRIERFFGDLASLEQHAAQLRAGDAGLLSIGTSANLAFSVVAQAAAAFRQLHPGLRFDLKAQSSRQVMDAVQNHQVDLGIVDTAQQGLGTEFVELDDIQLACIMRPDHRLAAQGHVDQRQLDGEALITFPEDTQLGSALRDALQRSGARCPVTFNVNQTIAAYTLVQCGGGIAVVDAMPMLLGAFEGLVARRLSPAVSARPRIVTSTGRPLSGAARAFIPVLQQFASRAIAATALRLARPP